MSVSCMHRVWGLNLPTPEKFILLCLADWASDDGSNVFPSLARVGWKTGMSERNVRRIVGRLLSKGLLKVVRESSQHRPCEYKINTKNGVSLRPFFIQGGQFVPPPGGTNATLTERSGGTNETPRGDNLSPYTLEEPLESKRTVRDALGETDLKEQPEEGSTGEDEKMRPPHPINCHCMTCQLKREEIPDGGKTRRDKNKQDFRRRNGATQKSKDRFEQVAKPALPAFFIRFQEELRRYHAGMLYPSQVDRFAMIVQELGEELALSAWVYCLETTRDPTKVTCDFTCAAKAFIPPAGWKPTGKHHPVVKEAKNGNGSGMTAEQKAEVMAKLKADLARQSAAAKHKARGYANA